ncbi:type III-B CRISPR module RAMP protein Cmr1 [Thermodesulfatator autotrophicus]|uniref:CRISPR type III-associated protein domain-containing protein n=1 Tax=Thermodesulfatator autotrophicus TaxID=1795632 RepID=A0A177E602_9BACT|nr:type III-B CRISPR module RAMP protein Cmr1 [Thermodesulfatator autotrophicus]OAG26921.1 hypothetical protein TH606_09650 [Thermodesulfatator autotrophicus]
MNKQDRLKNLRQRFDKLVTIKFKCRIITPMFLGDAEQKASLRSAPFKGLLRYWWRVAAGRKFPSYSDLLKEETKIFGGGGEESKKSLVRVEVEGNPQVVEDPRIPGVNNVRHPEVIRPVHPLLYLGYGPVIWKKGKGAIYNRSYLNPEDTFQLILRVPGSLLNNETFKLALILFRAFGAVGSRSRNGWGSFQVEKIEGCPHWDENFTERLPKDLPSWKDCFNKSYPHTLAKGDNDKLLLWKIEEFESWEKAMKFLAEVYIYVRTGVPQRGYKWPKQMRLDADAQNLIAERHLLGFPLTNHPARNAGWKRLASPLHFFIRRGNNNKYLAFILHLPYFIESAQRFVSQADQIKLWQKVHQRLDDAMQRASINDCL